MFTDSELQTDCNKTHGKDRPANKLKTGAYALLCAISTIAVSACATNSPSSAPSETKRADTCVFFSALYDWQSLDDSNLVVWLPGKNDAYRVSLTMPLMGLKHAHTLGFVDGTQDGRLCGFGRDAISIADLGGNDSMSQRSTIRSIEPLNAESLALLEGKYKTKLVRESRRKAPPKAPDRTTAQ